jgi:membrane fusion protein (multidrug efflux system)
MYTTDRASRDRLRAAALVIATIVVVSGGCGEDAGSSGGFRREVPLVAMAAALPRTIREELEAIGTTYANESVVVTAKVTDTVSRVNFEDGELVEAGHILVELTNSEETALLAEAQANLDDAQRQYGRLQDLLRQRSVPVSQVDEAKARLEGAGARHQSVVARLNDRLVRAPFTGLLGFRQVSPGTLVTPGTAITTLDDVSVIKLDFSIPEVHLGLIRQGLRLFAESPAYPDTGFRATVATIGSRIDPITRAATIRAHIDNEQLLLRPGMLMVVRLTTAERTALMVPDTAIVQRGDAMYVFTLGEGDVAHLTRIEHGRRYQSWVEVVGGIEAGTEVISDGIVKVRNDSPVARIGGEPIAVGEDAVRDGES